VITKATAEKFFGNENPINKTLTIETYGDFKVTGVFEEMPLKSHFVFDGVVSFSTVNNLINREIFQNNMDKWSSFYDYYTYLLLDERSGASELEAVLPAVAKQIFPEEELNRFSFKIQPLLSINLGLNLGGYMPGTKHSFEIIFIPFVALIIVFLACFNYMNLTIARSLRRTKEIGLRKVIGSRRSQIMKLFLSEAFVITFFALIAAVLLLLWLIPGFNSFDAIELTKSQINIDLMKDMSIYIYFLLFALFVSIVAGIYPALHLSSFLPVDALKGVSKVKSFSRFLTRKILIASQFTISIIAIILILFIQRQHTFMVTYDKGINLENTVNVRLNEVDYDLFRNEIASNSSITGISASSGIPVYSSWWNTIIKPPGWTEDIRISYYSIDENFIENFDLTLIAGRNFSHEFSTDGKNAAIINEKAVEFLELGSPEKALGKIISTKDSLTVIGVLRDFNFKGLENSLEPLLVLNKTQHFENANIKYLPGKKEEIRSFLVTSWEKFDKVHPVMIDFFDDLAQDERVLFQDLISISSWACGFIMLIALLGLLGMTAYNLEIRIKEIGIRKVMGASVSGIVMLLSKDFMKLILYSGAVAIPLSYLLSSLLLQAFAYRVSLSIWVFAFGLFIVLSLALVIIVSQTVKAAFTNPVETLREE
jgi:putative ABC transport system permease protein